MLAEFRQLRKGVAEAVRQIVKHEGEINALQSVIQYKGLATGQELDAAIVESTQQLRQILDGPDTGDSDERSRRLSQKQGSATNSACRGRRVRPAARRVRPRP